MTPIESLSEEDKQTVVDALKSGNSRLFQLSCASFDVCVNEAELFCKNLLRKQLIEQYENLNFATKRKIKILYCDYINKTFNKRVFISKFKILFNVVNEENVDILSNLVHTDDTGLYPNAVSFVNRYNTKRPKNMRKDIVVLYPIRNDEKHVFLKRKVCHQMDFELDNKNNDYLSFIPNEYTFRVEMNTFIDSFDLIFNKCLIKSRKVCSMEDIVNHINPRNKKRDTDIRCDDMLTCEMLLKKHKKECELKLNKAKNRAVKLGIATINNNKMEMKIRVHAFGSYKPTSMYTEYRLIIGQIQMKLDKVQTLINKLSNVDVSGLIGNITKKKRSKYSKNRKRKNSEAVAISREKKNAEKEDLSEVESDLENENEEMKMEVDDDNTETPVVPTTNVSVRKRSIDPDCNESERKRRRLC